MILEFIEYHTNMYIMYPTNPKFVEVNPSWCMQICVHESLVGACKYWWSHVFLVPSPNLHDCSINPSSISHLGNPSWSMQIVPISKIVQKFLPCWSYMGEKSQFQKLFKNNNNIILENIQKHTVLYIQKTVWTKRLSNSAKIVKYT